jgi:hypothetical protein
MSYSEYYYQFPSILLIHIGMGNIIMMVLKFSF